MMRNLLVLTVAVLLSACVTTEVGENPSPVANQFEAAQLNLDLGVSYFRQGNMTASREKLERAIGQNPKLSGAYRILGLVYQELGDPAEAEKQYVKSVRLTGNNVDSLNDYAGFLCFEKREVDKALIYFDRALAVPLNDNRSMLYSNAARCVEQSDPERAENYLRAALAADRNNPQLMAQIAALAYKQQQYLQARVFLERALEVGEPDASILYLLSKTDSQLGNIANAGKYRKQLLEEYPLSEEAAAMQAGSGR
jgi:type IV pilus assembly protein PilF